jgi:peptide deformylase
MVLPIKKVPDPVLRKPGVDVKFPLAPGITKLVRDMFDTVQKAQGIGLAAPQVGRSLRVIVVNLEHIGMPAFALINPEVKSFSKNKTKMEEGCLSIPGVFGIVERPEKIVFTGRTLSGETVTAEASGLLSKVLQHEIDHTNGVLITDKILKYTSGEDVQKV